MKTLTILAISVISAASIATAEDVKNEKPLAERTGETLNHAGEKTGAALKKGAEKTGEAAHAVGEKAVEAGHAVVDESKKVGHSVVVGTKKAGEAVADAVTPDKTEEKRTERK